jgi:4-cresol dehydrogenase (hydroxylating)
MTIVLPSGVSEVDVTAALDALVIALGSDKVTIDEAEVREFRDPYAFRGSDANDAAAAVSPTTVEEVQAVVRIANEHRVPLWTIGQGRNNTYGGAAPRVRGSIIVNLREMNRVLEVDEDLCYAVVEPGVRWFDLHDALEAAGGRCWPSIPDLGWGSVVGNSLEYGRGYTPYGDHARNICGMEVVLPSGEVLRTGMGGQTGNTAWHVYQHSYGPSLDGLFMQSNFGIVTKMGVWVMPRPEVYASCSAAWEGEDALAAVTDTLRELMLEGIIRNSPVMGRGIGVFDDRPPAIDPTDPVWRLRFALYGREPIVDAHWAIAEQALAAIPGVTVTIRRFAGTDLDGPTGHDDMVQRGIPEMQLMDLFKTPFGEDTAHLDFSPVGPLTGEDVVATYRLVRDLYDRRGWPYLGGLIMMPRNVIHVTTTFFDPHDEERTREVYAAYDEMVLELGKAGKVPYRTNIHHMDLVGDQLDFGDHIQRRTNEAIKDALDPNGILSPGKQGIWPRGRRGAS